MRACLITALLTLLPLGTLLLGAKLQESTGAKSPEEFDATGVGTCTVNGDLVSVSGYSHVVWAVSPRRATDSVPLDALDFTGKNAVVTMGQTIQLTTVLTTATEEDTTFTLRMEGDVVLTESGDCSFTLDGVDIWACAVTFGTGCDGYRGIK